MTARNSAAARAQELRAAARRGVWRRVLTLLGVTAHTRHADAEAARWGHGAAGEDTTAGMLRDLEGRGWLVRHDLSLPGCRWNLDHVLVAPDGTVVVLDTKAWHRGQPTTLVRGRVHCGSEDRHDQVQKVADYARRVAAVVGLPATGVRPLLVVHGSPITGGFLQVQAGGETVYVLGPAYLVPTLSGAPGAVDAVRAGSVAQRVFSVLRPHGEGGRS